MSFLLVLALACSDSTDDTATSTDDTATETTTTDDSGDSGVIDADGDGSPAGLDCDDNDDEVRFGLDEVCDGKDNDCNGVVDDPYALDATTWYLDADQDGRGTDDVRVYACDQPEGYAVSAGDCDDLDPTLYPGAEELCDNIDQDCDGRVDEDAVGEGSTWYYDYDQDGYGSPDYYLETCARPENYVDNADDCDDLDADAWPGADEVCDGDDDDCDGEVDETDAVDAATWYIDYDDDGYGSAAYTTEACDVPDGWTDNADDCNDIDADVRPGADEYCNGEDDDCDGDTDETGSLDPETWYRDADNDGYGDASSTTEACSVPSGYSEDATDCDDNDPTSYPSATEVCDDADNNCDGETDEDTASDAATWYRDVDEDGDGDATDSVPACDQPSGYVATDTDCDDDDATAFLGATEYCDGVDNDCDDEVDEDSAADATTWYEDADSDGFGLATSSQVTCYQPTGYVADSDDCDDSDGTVSPDGEEVCDAVDNNCDGTIDEDDATDASTWYADVDGDGYGDSGSSRTACEQPSNHESDGSDCDDSDGAVNPAASEVCEDGVDNDCDGTSNTCALAGALSETDAVAVLNGESSGDQAGTTVAYAGDIDGDGILDLLIGAPADDEGGGSAGAAHLVYGPVTGTLSLGDTTVIKFVGHNSSDEAGLAVTNAGDLDDDGWDDVAIGAPNADEGEYRSGSVFIQYGPVGADTDLESADERLDGPDFYENAGSSLAGLGDVNGDGYDDLAVGSPGLAGGGTTGAVWLLHGPPSTGTLDDEASAHLTGGSSEDEAGAALAPAGDVDGDGYDDYWVGGPGEDGGGTDAGAAWLILGTVTGESSLGSSATVKIVGADAGDHAGSAIAAGDLDGDGTPDVAIGAPEADADYADAGRVYVLLAPTTGTLDLGEADAILSGESTSDAAGTSVAAGDLDADGVDDLAIGAPDNDAGGTSAGIAYLVYGPFSGSTSLSSADAYLLGSGDGALGKSIALGDSNGDAYDDLFTGVPGSDTDGTDAGGALILVGTGL